METNNWSTGQKVGVGAAITVAVAAIAEGTRRWYQSRQDKRAEAAKIDAAAAEHIAQQAATAAKVKELEAKIEQLLNLKVQEAASA